MATVIITRSSEYTNRLRAIGVYIDGEKVGTIANGETKEFSVPEGAHVLTAKIDWCGSKKFSFSVSENENKAISLSSFAYPNFIPLSGLALGISLLFKVAFKSGILMWLPLAVFLYMAYYLTIGRNDYLKIRDR